MANPLAIRLSPPSAENFRKSLELLDHFTPEEISEMVSELPTYKTLANNWEPEDRDLMEIDSVVQFWKASRHLIINIRKFVRYANAITTSSAAAERVFSVIKRSFDTSQKGALEDYVFLSSIMQYNRIRGINNTFIKL